MAWPDAEVSGCPVAVASWVWLWKTPVKTGRQALEGLFSVQHIQGTHTVRSTQVQQSLRRPCRLLGAAPHCCLSQYNTSSITPMPLKETPYENLGRHQRQIPSCWDANKDFLSHKHNLQPTGPDPYSVLLKSTVQHLCHLRNGQRPSRRLAEKGACYQVGWPEFDPRTHGVKEK